MIRPLLALTASLGLVLLHAGCEKRVEIGSDGQPVIGPDGKPVEGWHFLGQPDPGKKWQPPTAITDFHTLYTRNCVGCHGSGKGVGGMIALDNPTLVKLIPKDRLTDIITNGVKGALMPAFGIARGGDLTDEQIAILVDGILSQPPPAGAAGASPLPPFAGSLGNAAAGQAVYTASCASCHGKDGAGSPAAGSVVDPAYLGLVSDQYLRTVMICGRPDLGMPAPVIAGKPLTDQEVSDLVAWLVSHRQNEFGQPLVPAAAAPAPESSPSPAVETTPTAPTTP